MMALSAFAFKAAIYPFFTKVRSILGNPSEHSLPQGEETDARFFDLHNGIIGR